MFNPRISGADRTLTASIVGGARAGVTGPARLFSITFFNTGPNQYIQVFDAITATGTPKVVLKVLADSHGSIDFTDGRLFATGIYVINSTTPIVVTTGATDCQIEITYRLTT